MLGSPILDVAIGMAFVYLLLSLIVSAIQEILASFMQARAANLERGLRSLFSGDKFAANGELRSFVELIYGHGLIRGLYQDPDRDFEEVLGPVAKVVQSLVNKFKWYFRYLSGLALRGETAKTANLLYPAYIPSRTFALALIDILKTGATAARPAAGEGMAPVADPAAGQGQPPVANPVANQGPAPGEVAGQIAGQPPAGGGGHAAPPVVQSWIEQLEATLARALQVSQGENKAVEALLALVRDAENQPAKAQAATLQTNIENWYNDSMDRVSGWYKHYAQKILIVIGLAIAVGLNVDSIRVARMLWLDKDARTTITAAAGDYLANHPELKSAQSGGTDSSKGQPQTGADKTAGTVEGLANHVNGAYTTFNQISTQSLLPVGWRHNPIGYIKRLDEPAMRMHLLLAMTGWIITAIALSLGAPFWFDLLNKFMVVRGTVKPSEKSGTDKSKDN